MFEVVLIVTIETLEWRLLEIEILQYPRNTLDYYGRDIAKRRFRNWVVDIVFRKAVRVVSLRRHGISPHGKLISESCAPERLYSARGMYILRVYQEHRLHRSVLNRKFVKARQWRARALPNS